MPVLNEGGGGEKMLCKCQKMASRRLLGEQTGSLAMRKSQSHQPLTASYERPAMLPITCDTCSSSRPTSWSPLIFLDKLGCF